MLDLRFFRNPRFTAATTAITLVFFAMFGSYFIFTQYLQFVHGYDPLQAGVRMLPWALAYMLSATQSAKLVERFGQRRVVSSGLLDRRRWPRDRGGDELTDQQLLAVRGRARGAGARHGAHDRTVDGRDHAVAAAAQGRRRLGGERHHARARRRARRRGARQPGGVALPVVDPQHASADCRRQATHSLAEALQHAAAVGGARGDGIATCGAGRVRRRLRLDACGWRWPS